jgi:hypothetical protein
MNHVFIDVTMTSHGNKPRVNVFYVPATRRGSLLAAFFARPPAGPPAGPLGRCPLTSAAGRR